MGYKSRDFFTYVAAVGDIPANQSANYALNIEQDSDFSWDKSTFFAGNVAVTAATRIIPAATVQIQDSGSGRYLMNGPVPLASLFGTGELPFILPEPKVFSSRSTFIVTVANYDSGTQIDDLYLVFIGQKLFL